MAIEQFRKFAIDFANSNGKEIGVKYELVFECEFSPFGEVYSLQPIWDLRKKLIIVEEPDYVQCSGFYVDFIPKRLVPLYLRNKPKPEVKPLAPDLSASKQTPALPSSVSEIIATLALAAEAKERLGEEMASRGYKPKFWCHTRKPESWSGLLFTYDPWLDMPPSFVAPPTGYPTYYRVVRGYAWRVDARVVWSFLK